MLDDKMLFGLLILGVVMLTIIGVFDGDEKKLNFMEVMKYEKLNEIPKIKSYLKYFDDSDYERYKKVKEKLIALRFKRAKIRDTIKEYETFLKDFESDGLKTSYRNRVHIKIMEKKYKIAKSKDSIEGLKEFQKKYPLMFKVIVQEDIKEAYYKKACKDKTIKSYTFYIKKYPNSKYAKLFKKEILKIKYNNLDKSKGLNSWNKVKKELKGTKYEKIAEREKIKIYRKDFEKRDLRGTRNAYLEHLEKYNYDSPFNSNALEAIDNIDNRSKNFVRINKLKKEFILKAELDGISFDINELNIDKLTKNSIDEILQFTNSKNKKKNISKNNSTLKIECRVEPLRRRYRDEHNEYGSFIYNGVFISGTISLIQLNSTIISEKFKYEIIPPTKLKNGYWIDSKGIKYNSTNFKNKKNAPYNSVFFKENSYIHALIKVLYKIYGDNFIISLIENKNIKIRELAKIELKKKYPKLKNFNPDFLRMENSKSGKFIKEILFNLTSFSTKIRLKNIKILEKIGNIYSIPIFIEFLDDIDETISNISYNSLKRLSKNNLLSKNKIKWDKWWKKQKIMLKPMKIPSLFYWFNDKRIYIK